LRVQTPFAHFQIEAALDFGAKQKFSTSACQKFAGLGTVFWNGNAGRKVQHHPPKAWEMLQQRDAPLGSGRLQ
jgi:hypothetical protein